MRVWALLPLLASSGCLFLDRLNQAPSVALAATITSTIKGALLTVSYVVTDDEDTGLDPQFDIADATGAPLDPTCDYSGVKSGGTYQLRLYRTGTFAVRATARDRHGALSNTSTIMVAIEDAPPKFDADAMVIQTSTPHLCKPNTAGDTITLKLENGVSDADAGAASVYPSCAGGETLTYTWRIRDRPSGTKPVLTLHDGSGCVPPTAQSGLTVQAPDAVTQVCLWTDEMIVGATAAYNVVLDVSDGTSTTTSPVGTLTVSPDEPPCITGTNPIAGSWVVDRTQLQEFAVDGVLDDRDLFGVSISYVWSVWRESDPTWRVVPSWTLSTYQLDVSSYGVGEKVRVRVEALDRTGARASASMCPIDGDDCVVSSCASSPNVCHKWKTWDLELR